jgi:hypothetical protein
MGRVRVWVEVEALLLLIRPSTDRKGTGLEEVEVEEQSTDMA